MHIPVNETLTSLKTFSVVSPNVCVQVTLQIQAKRSFTFTALAAIKSKLLVLLNIVAAKGKIFTEENSWDPE